MATVSSLFYGFKRTCRTPHSYQPTKAERRIRFLGLWVCPTNASQTNLFDKPEPSTSYRYQFSDGLSAATRSQSVPLALVPNRNMLARVLARVLVTLLHDLAAANAAAHHHSIHTFDADPLNTRHRPTGHTRQRHKTLSPRGTDTVCDHTKHNPSPTWDAMSQYHLLTYPRVRPEAVLSPRQEIQR